jgi:hypothetical protein
MRASMLPAATGLVRRPTVGGRRLGDWSAGTPTSPAAPAPAHFSEYSLIAGRGLAFITGVVNENIFLLLNGPPVAGRENGGLAGLHLPFGLIAARRGFHQCKYPGRCHEGEEDQHKGHHVGGKAAALPLELYSLIPLNPLILLIAQRRLSVILECPVACQRLELFG